MTGFGNVLLAAVAGFTIHLAFPSAGIWPAAPIGLALLWRALEGAGWWRGFGLGVVAGFGFYLPILQWARESVGPIPWVALSLLEAVFMGVFAGTWAVIQRNKTLHHRVWLEPVVFAALWTSAEQLRSIVPFGGFPWGRLAFSQVDSPIGALGWVGGAAFVSFAVALAGGCCGLAWEARRGRRVAIPLVSMTAAVAIFASGGLIHLDTAAETGTLRIGVAQGSVPNLGLDSFAQARLVLDNHVAVTEALVANQPWVMDVIIWPENSADYDPRVDQTTFDAVTGVAKLAAAPILVGTQDLSLVRARLNIALLWSVDGVVIDSYAKRHPAPFAEYIPMRAFARFFSKDVDRVTRDMIPGTEVGVLTLPSPRLGREVQLADVICFEVAYDSLVRDAIRGGGEVLIVQTNNANFGLTAESDQQLAMTRFRAIETGRSAVQASTVGVSGIVAPDGSLIEETGHFTADYMFAEVPLRTSLTPAMRIGSVLDGVFLLGPWLVWLWFALLGLRGRWDWE